MFGCSKLLDGHLLSIELLIVSLFVVFAIKFFDAEKICLSAVFFKDGF